MIAHNKIVFSDEEKKFLIDNYKSMSNKELASALNKNITRTRIELYSLGLKRMELEYWTDEQVKYLKDNFETKGDTEIAKYFNAHFFKSKGWTKKHIEKKRRYLKLKRSKEIMHQIKQRNIAAGDFKDCSNKMWITRGVAEEGTIKVWKLKDKLFQVIKTQKGFEPLNRFIWQMNHGNIPEGNNIVFKDGNPMNCTIENLEMLTNAENASRNSKNRIIYPENIKEIQRLINKLNKKIQEHGTE
jgi:hypothetical protein